MEERYQYHSKKKSNDAFPVYEIMLERTSIICIEESVDKQLSTEDKEVLLCQLEAQIYEAKRQARKQKILKGVVDPKIVAEIVRIKYELKKLTENSPNK